MKKRQKNGVAKALRTPRYKMRVISNKTAKKLIALLDKAIKELDE